MEKLLLVILLFFALTISGHSNSDKNQSNKCSDQQIESFVRKFFQGKTNELVHKSSGARLVMITDFLQNRVSTVFVNEYRDKKNNSVSDFPLSNKYNSKLERDPKISAVAFNLLKYNLLDFLKIKRFTG